MDENNDGRFPYIAALRIGSTRDRIMRLLFLKVPAETSSH